MAPDANKLVIPAATRSIFRFLGAALARPANRKVTAEQIGEDQDEHFAG